MNVDEFWELTESTRPADGSCAGHAAAVVDQLAELDPNTIVEFDGHFRRALVDLYHWDLWAVAYIVQGGCSDDGFEYFRAAVIGQGRQRCELARTDPVQFGLTLDPDGALEDRECEDLLYAAAIAHERRAGTELPMPDVFPPAEPAGNAWDEDSVGDQFPELAARFGYDDDDDTTTDFDPYAHPSHQALLDLAEPHYRGDWEAAARIGQQIVDDEPDDVLLVGVAQAITGHARFRLGDRDAAIALLVPLFADPDRRDGPVLILSDVLTFAYAAAVALDESGRTAEARDLLVDALAIAEERRHAVPVEVTEALAAFGRRLDD